MDPKTLQNLKDAFAGESQANRKYLAFAATRSPLPLNHLAHAVRV
jgi:rubrerythrin